MAEQKKKRVSWFHIAISVALTGIMLWLVFAESEGGEDGKSFFTILSEVNLRLVGLFVCLSLAGVFVRALRYRLLLNGILGKDETPSFGRLLLITITRNALVDMLPARLGEAGYIYFLNRSGVPVTAGATSFGFCIVLDAFVLFIIIALLLLLQILFPFDGAGHLASGSSRLIALGIAAAAFALSYLLVRKLPKIFHWLGRVLPRLASRSGLAPIMRAGEWVHENVEQIAIDLDRLAASRSLMRLAHHTFWLRVLKYLSLYVLMLSVVGQWNLTAKDIPPIVALVAFLIAEASASLPISGLMGFGAYESSWSFVLSQAGVSIPAASIVTVAFIIHLISQIKAYTLASLAIVTLFVLDIPKRERAHTVAVGSPLKSDIP